MTTIRVPTYTDKEVLERIEKYAVIHLTQNEITFVDREDFARVNRFKWYAMFKSNKSFYAQRRIGKYTHAIQNFIMNFNPTLDKEKRTTDHINRIPLDNWKTNLRIVSRIIQNINRKKLKTNKSGKDRVSFDKFNNSWDAYFMLNGKRKHKAFYVRSEANGYELAKQRVITYMEQMEKEIPIYQEALHQHENIHIDSKNYNLKDIERSNNDALRLRGIKQSNKIGHDGVIFKKKKNSWYAEWHQNNKHYSKRFKVRGKNEGFKTAYGQAVSYHKTMNSY